MLLDFFITKIRQIIYRKKLHISPRTVLPKNILIRLSDNARIEIGEKSVFRSGIILNASDCGTIVIGDRVFFNDRCCLNSRKCITIGNDTIIGQDVLFYDHDHDYRKGPIKKMTEYRVEEIHIGSRVWIGSNVVVLKGATVGDNSVIGAGCIVRGNIPENTLLYPATEMIQKSIKEYDHEIS